MKIGYANSMSAINNTYKSNIKKEYNISSSKSNADRIEISDLGKYLNKVSKNNKDINIDKVNDIKSKIENGTYHIDSRELAKKIINKMKDDIQ